MRVVAFLAAGLAVFTQALPAGAQVLSGRSRVPKGEVRWMDAYIGWSPQAWFKRSAPLTPELLAQTARHPADSLSLVLLPDYRVQLPSGAQYLRVQLLNPTPRPAPIERADATVMGIGLVLRLDDQWVRPAYPPESYCGNSFWQDTLAARSGLTFELDAYQLYKGTIPVEARIVARVNQTTVRSAVFTVQLTPLQLYFLRHPRVPLPDIN